MKERANSFLAYGVKAKDALHVAAAIEGKADVFITTDDGLLKKLAGVAKIQAANPIDIAGDIDDDHN